MFAPREEGHVRIYMCGLTPSAEAHLGHARSFVFFDVLRRYLVHRGYRVTYVQNVTDIDDRSIATARQTGENYTDIVERNYGSFKASMARLRVREPDVEPRATHFVPQILAMIEELIATGHAYVAGDGVYFRVRSFPRYGALSGKNVDELMVGARIAEGEEKADPLDFALWKFAKPGEPMWKAPWGDGRPGWHIECSAMSRDLLGVPLDIHGGGHDLVFPHHENEIAQSEPLMAEPPMADFWVHGGLLNFDGKKMSKSLGNFEPLTSVLERLDPQAIRLLFLRTGYRKPAEFNEAVMSDVTTSLHRLQDAYDALRTAPPGTAGPEAEQAFLAARWSEFHGAMDDDMNTAGALAGVFGVAGEAERLKGTGLAGAAAGFMHQAMDLLGISPTERTARRGPDVQGAVRALREHLPALAESVEASAIKQQLHGAVAALEAPAPDAALEAAMREVLLARGEARRAKDFALSDRLRDTLAAAGVALKDTKDGTTWTVGGD